VGESIPPSKSGGQIGASTWQEGLECAIPSGGLLPMQPASFFTRNGFLCAGGCKMLDSSVPCDREGLLYGLAASL